MEWRSVVLDLPPEGERLLFYSLDCDHIYVGIFRDGRWFDEGEHIDGVGAPEIGEVTHWMTMPTKPSR